MRKPPSAYMLFILSLVLFGTNGVVADGIDLPSTQIVLLRTFFGAIFLMAIFLMRGGRYSITKNRRQMLYLLISGISMGVSWIFLYEAYVLIGVSTSSMIYYCGPAIVMFLSPFIFHERLTLSGVFGFTVVAAGACLMCAEAFVSDAGMLGYVYSIASAVAHAAMVIFSKMADEIDGMENSSLQLLYAFLIVLVYTVVGSKGFATIDASDWGNILFLGFVNTGLGCLLYFSTITVLSAQTVSMSGYLEPLSAVVFAALLLGEMMTVLQIIGSFMILFGALYAELRSKDVKSMDRTIQGS